MGLGTIPGDFESRNQDPNTEWSLNKNILLKVFHCLNISPSIDLFASRLTFKLDKYVSWKPDPGSQAVDVFRHKFHNEIFYAFPPFCVIVKFLKKVGAGGLKGVIIVPMWSTQAFSHI